MAKQALGSGIFEDGSASIPSIAFASAPGVGLYRLSSGNGVGVVGTLYSDLGLIGTTTNDQPQAGGVGEYIQASRLRSANSGATTATAKDVLASPLSLTAGDWEVTGTLGIVPAAGTSITLVKWAISTIATTMPASTDTYGVPTSNQVTGAYSTAAMVPGANNDMIFSTPTCRISLPSTTNIYLVCNITFSVSTLGVYGGITARRVR